MQPRIPLPDGLDDVPFTILDAAKVGVGRSRLEHRDLHRPTYGVRSVHPVVTLRDQARALTIALPSDCAFGRQSAAELWGMPLPRVWTPGDPVHVLRDDEFSPIRRRGVTGSSGLQRRTVVTRQGLRLTSQLDTWLDLGSTLDLDGLVVAGDSLIAWRSGRTRSELEQAITDRPHGRMSASVKQALTLVRAGSASPGESRARLLFHRHGLPEPELNANILDPDGNWIATCDFVWRESRLIVEYDGDQHRTDAATWRGDYRRTGELERFSWRVIRMTADDVARPDSLVQRIRATLGAPVQTRVA